MKFSTATNIGARHENQDRFLATEDRWIVCDGHGDDGSVFASYLVREAAKLNPNVEEIESFFNNLSLNPPFPNIYSGGTTFAGVFKKEDKFLAVMLGDSRIFYRRDDVVYEIPDHSMSHQYNPDIPKLEDMGAKIIQARNGAHYISKNGRYLALSRRFGDKYFGELVSLVPDFYLFEADAIIVSSDGFTGNTKIVKTFLDSCSKACDIEKWQDPTMYDNFTAIVAYA